MKRLLLYLLPLFASGYSFSQQIDRSQLNTEINTNFYTNTQKKITGDMLNDILKKISASAWITLTDGTPIVFPSNYTVTVASTDTFLMRKTSNGLFYKVPASSITVSSNTYVSPLVLSSGTVTINSAAADGSTKGAASFNANDFNSLSGNISIDYTNGQAASGSTKGFLTSADWTTFNGKQDALVSGTNIKTVNSTSLLGSGNVSVEPVISAGTTSDYWRGDKTWQSFNTAARSAVSLTTTGTSGAATYNSGTGVLNVPNYSGGASQWTTTGSDIYYNTGNVGIGNSSPDAKIDVVSTSTVNPVASFSVNTSGSTNATGVNINAEGGTTTDALVVNSKSNVSGGINNSIVALATTANGGYNNPLTSIAQNGDYNYGGKILAQGGVDAVGLSISASGASGNNNAIDITAGNFKYTPGSEGSGKVLTSDANGVASWQTPAAGGSASVTITDDNSTNATMYPTWVAANSGSQPVKVSSTKFVFKPSNGWVGLNTTSPLGALDIRYNGYNSGFGSLCIGADGNTTDLTTLTDATKKIGTIVLPHYTNAQKPVTFLYGDIGASNSILNIGGGISTQNAATQVRIFVASTQTTTTGTLMGIWSTAGLGINTSNYQATLQVVGSGSTSATQSFKVLNSANDTIFKIRDDGKLFYKDGNQGAGKVITSDAIGMATWQTPAASASVTITDDNSTNATMYPAWYSSNSGGQMAKVSSTKMKWNPSGGFLGIGITPDTNLHVNGKIKLTNDLIFDEPNSTATNRGFSISTRDIAVDYPAISFRPRTNNTVCALDIMPRGTSVTENTGNGFAWVDVCSADILNNNNSINSARVGVRSDRIEFGSKIFNGATARALVLSVQTSAGTVVPSLWIDNTGKKIGLNTTSPNWSLQVHQDVGGESSVSSFTNVNTGSAITDGLNVGVDATGNGFLLLRENLKLSFWTNATERMNISSSGHLLFNTDNTLDIGASGATRPRSIYAGTSSVSPLIVGGSGTTQSLTYKTTSGVGTTGADHIFQVGNNGATEAMRILNSGSVGIGTSSPASKLDVEGGVSIGATYSGTTAAPTNGAIIEGDVAIGATSTTAKLQVTDANRSGGGAAISATVTNTVSVSTNSGVNSVVSTTGSSTNNYAFSGVASGATVNFGIVASAQNPASANYGGYFSAQGGTNNYALVAMNGKVGIGTDTPTELFQVSGTASVSITSDGKIIQNGLITYNKLVSVADDGTFDIPAGTTGWCEVIAGVSSTIDGAIAFRFTNDGAVVETRVADAIASATADTDTKLCAFDNGSNVRIKNRLGGTRDLLIKLTYR